jgi:hypothetical protein
MQGLAPAATEVTLGVSATRVGTDAPAKRGDRAPRRGTAQVVARCVALLRGQDVVDDFILTLDGPGGHRVLDDGPEKRKPVLAAGLGYEGVYHLEPGALE